MVQLELLPQPPLERSAETPWPFWPLKLRTSHAHEEGGVREWSILTRRLVGEGGSVRYLDAVRVEPQVAADGRPGYREVPGGEIEIAAELVILAMGFTGPQPSGLLSALGVELDTRGAVRVDPEHRSSVPGIYAAGDMHRGASLIVWAIREGRDAASAIDRDLRSGAAGRESAA